MDIKTVATGLLIGRLISFVFIVMVIWQQIKLFKRPAKRYVILSRRVLFIISIAAFLGTLVPIIIDTATIFDSVRRNSHPDRISVAYGISNCGTAVIMTLGLWLLYYFARKAYNEEAQARKPSS